ncbi:uncharacterized protein JN550_003875 [Neoarthrinium moseri]|uniref:uncharacterized protein n=1 Tax=Neoarthrinium moseri TaxID=1658444 RepID=UPI001FDC63AA|nr:uncharacterized protein JN550_003875 [Neoarthrinium moseri]KAI1873001.1 hypothetical protein JN550_003875 [Neoarthrinium moseri]
MLEEAAPQPEACGLPFASLKPDTAYSMCDDPVCIVGLACRLPGDIQSPSELWDFIMKKRSAQGPLPAMRFNMKGFYHPDTARAGVMGADGGYFLQRDVRKFENSFFGVNNLEATYMDPQQRQLLEVVYECFENAGVSLENISGSNTGVYVGNFTMDFQTMQTRDPDYGSRYTATGTGTAILANRISHIFNLHGPSFTLDTACSSSIYCLHNAVRAIQSGDCDNAIVAAANLITSPEQHLGTMKGGVLSPTSTCHTFDVSADGYGRAEGVNAIYLKKLSSALKDGDKVWSVIRGTAINANGKTAGIAQPNAVLQEAVIRKAYSDAGLRFGDTDYVECHGTGTAVGDPIEVDALASCFTPRYRTPLLIGSVKTNLGHSEAASGLTSLIKVSLAFENDHIPPTYGVKTLNPKLKLDERNFMVVTDPQKWPGEIRRASINSFGYGGANAHVILECAKSYLRTLTPSRDMPTESIPRVLVLPVSAASRKSLEMRIEQVRQLACHSNKHTMKRLAFTLSQRRSSLVTKRHLLVQACEDGSFKYIEDTKLETAESTPTAALPLAFVFTGQGAQYAGMGKELLSTDETFLATIRQLDQVLKAIAAPYGPEWSLEQTMLDPPDHSQVHHVTRSQPLCTAIQIGLVKILRAWGISAHAVVGHSSGEIAAAYAAGLLTESQAIKVAYFRGYAADKLQSVGAMMAAGISADAASNMISEKGLDGQVCVACVNSPMSVTLSGEPECLSILEAALKGQGMFARKLETGGRAYHSYMMQEIGDLYEQLLKQPLEDIQTGPLAATMFSSVGHTDESLRTFGESFNTTTYWRENLEKPVQFNGALTNLLAEKNFHIIEIGPHSALKGPIQQVRAGLRLSNQQLPYNCTLVRNIDAGISLKNLAGNLFIGSHKLNWFSVNGLPRSGLTHLHDLPPYPWDYPEVLFHEPRPSHDLRQRKYIRHELLGSKQLAGDGIQWSWRNILRLSEMPWIKGHKVDNQVVFPATGYLSVAIEALSQILGIKDAIADQCTESSTVFKFAKVNIAAALVIQADDETGKKTTELHTTMFPRRISTSATSSTWYDFIIVSWIAGQSTVHCTGGLRVEDIQDLHGTVIVPDAEQFELWAPDSWYEKGKEEGLWFEGDFKSLTSLRTDGNRVRPESICTTRLIPSCANDKNAMVYPVHPITIDACLQASIMGGTGGNLGALKAHLPVFISEARIRSLGRNVPDCEALIHTRSAKTGLSSQRIDATLRDSLGAPVVDLKDVRLSLYTSKTVDDLDSTESKLLRHPCLRTSWKPDITTVHSNVQDQFNRYIIEHCRRYLPESEHISSLAAIAALVDLVGHKNPSSQVVEISKRSTSCEEDVYIFDRVLGKDTEFPRCRSYRVIGPDAEGQIQGDANGTFDLAVLPDGILSQQCWIRCPKKLSSIVSDTGIIVGIKTDEALFHLQAAKFEVVEVVGNVFLATAPAKNTNSGGGDVFLVVHHPSPAVLEMAVCLIDFLQKSLCGCKIDIVDFDQLDSRTLSEKSICVSMIEVEHELLPTMSATDMNLLRRMTDNVVNLLWLTGASMLDSPKPDLTLSYGLSRALMLEQPSLHFSVMDIGRIGTSLSDTRTTCNNIIRSLLRYTDGNDKEFTQKDGLLYVSRFVPDMKLNELFCRRLENIERVKHEPLHQTAPARLDISQVGHIDSLHYQELREPLTRLPAGFIDVEVKAFSLNAKDVYALNGRVETKTATIGCEFSGIVQSVGLEVTGLEPGDRVVVMAPNHLSTLERVPAWAAHKILPGEDFATMASLPIVYSSAMYALYDRAHLRAGESVLIHSGAGALGLALINIAQRVGAVVYTTVGSLAKRDYLEREFGIPSTHIFSSRDSSFLEGIRKITEGRGVHVVVNSLVGDLMHASWECIAQFGRFVEVGKRELIDAGQLNMHAFLKNATFTAFDLSELFYQNDSFYHEIWASKISETLALYRSGQIKPTPLEKFDVADVARAFRYFSARERIGKVVVSLEDPKSIIPVAPAKYYTIFNPDKIYLLVGCLGGLGRSLSRWMMARGARRFCFLGRSGSDKPPAQALVNRLRTAGATVHVVRGDVSHASDVAACVKACKDTGHPIGGVIQAAMGLHEALFSRMSNTAWQTSIQPKWAGTWNLHNALEGEALDFFLLTSSMSGSVGTATESNYCAANGFLDAFARWRRSQGLPAVSVGLGMISEVGYLHENPEIEALLLRRGIQPLNEDEFLQVIDMSLALDSPSGVDESHVLTGLETFGFRKLMARGFDVDFEVVQDARMSVLSAAVAAEKEAFKRTAGQSQLVDRSNLEAAAPWFKTIPANVFHTFAQEPDALSIGEAVLSLTKKRFSNLILMPIDQIDDRKPLSQFGVDSMIAAEFRTWFWNSFRVDVPFLDLLSPQKDLSSLAEFVVNGVVIGNKSGTV